MNAGGESGQLFERLVLEIAQGVSGETGEGFFRSLARHLARVLEADYLLVGVLQNQDRIKTLAAYANGLEMPPIEYQLAGTPCEGVVGKGLCSFSTGVQHLFPQDLMLAEIGAEGYVGSPIVDSSGRTLGLICAITKRPVPNIKLAEALLQIFVTRAAAELERKNREEALMRSEQRLRALVDHGNEAVIRIELDQPFSPDLPEEEQIDLLYRHAYVADCNEQAAKLFGFATAAEMIGQNIDHMSSRSDEEQIERLRAGIRARWQFSQVERTIAGRTFLMTRQGEIEDGKLTGGWVTARDITSLIEAEAEVRRLNTELAHRVEELTDLKARLEQDNAYLLDEINADHNLEELTGSSAPFRELTEAIRRVAATSATVLISGETGTGKELVARAIHNLSQRHNRPLVKVNCAAISAGLVESELFGHVKGAFTGATESRMGRFEYANGGTIFLDEISELPAETQAKLLRVLQEQEFEPVGSNRTIKVDVRVLAASNRDLAEAVREGRFRMDLYYRLMVVPVNVPPLRARRDDIPALTASLIARLSRQFGRKVRGVTEGMMRRLVAYDWPGNIRELENFLARAIVHCPGELLDTPLEPARTVEAPPQRALSLEEAERQHIGNVLISSRWVVEGPNGAAEILKMNPSTLRSRMKRLGIHRPS